MSKNVSNHVLPEAEDQGPRLVQPVRITEQVWPEDTAPVVSICCTIYNHEKFIRECLDGFLMQETTFPIEVLIHDDASTDNTAGIIREYEARYPYIIKPVYQTENQYSKGTKPNPTFNFPRSKGKYIALCEGDDYWTDPQKLQKQVEFLKENRDFSVCFHRVKILNGNEVKDDYITREVPSVTDILEIAKGNYIHTLSVVFRRSWAALPDWFSKCPIGDYPLHLINAKYGKLKKLEDVMGVYRIHDTNIWANQKPEAMLLKIHTYLEAMIGNFPEEVNELLISRYTRVTLDLARGYFNSGKIEESSSFLIKAMQINPLYITKVYFNMEKTEKHERHDDLPKAKFLKIIKPFLIFKSK